MKHDVLSVLSGELMEKTELSDDIYGLPHNPDVINYVINWQLIKRMSGTHSTKNVSQIRGTTAKPHRQKGTGRARAGSLRSPQFRGGSTVFGPVVRDHGYRINKKLRKLGLKLALSYKLRSSQLLVVKDLDCGVKKTSEISSFIKSFGSCLFIKESNEYNNSFLLSIRNIPKYDVLPVVGLNVYDIMSHNILVVSSDALEAIEGRLM